ncbi:MAG: GGDEF domain-containing protein [Clostridia bacterium]|nr:GGDEF domain-containing protein [Clostridia bacterium]
MNAEETIYYENYKELIDSLQNEIAWISDVETYEMLYMTDRAKALISCCDDGYRNQKCYEVLHGNNRPCTFCPNFKLAAEGTYNWSQYNIKTKKWLSIEDRLLVHKDRHYRLEVAHEIRPEMLEIPNAESILLQSIQTLTTGSDFQTAINTFLEMVGGFYFADRTYVFELDFEKGVTNNTYEWCAEGVTAQIDFLQQVPISEVEDWVVQFLKKHEYVIRSVDKELEHDSDTYKRLIVQNIHSLLVAPLFIDDRLFGFIGVDNPELRIDNINLLRAASDVIAVELDKRSMLERLEYLSYTDMLTGVSNRNFYIKKLEENYRNPPSKLGVIVADINGLKGLNDQYGHKYGDSIIIRTAHILRDSQPFPVFRVGGDEFIIPCPEIEKTEFQAILQTLRDAFAADPECDVCIGSSWHGEGLDINTQISRADELLYVEKQTYYHDAIRDGKITRASALNELLGEIAANRFVVYYQPQIDLNNGKIVGAEALVRKLDADGNIVSPARFIPYYEAQGILMHVDLFVLDSVLQMLRELEQAGLHLHVSINFSRSTLLIPDFVEKICTACNTYGVPPQWITIEVTETISKVGDDVLLELLEQIHSAGFRLSLDDFGSQYSNLAMITDRGFDEVKFDKSLVDTLCENPRSRVVIKNIIQMCRELDGITVVAEGIETAEQAVILNAYQCDIGQGFHFHRPMPADDLVALLQKP